MGNGRSDHVIEDLRGEGFEKQKLVYDYVFKITHGGFYFFPKRRGGGRLE